MNEKEIMTNQSDSTQNSGEPIEKEFGDFCCRGDITGHCDCGHRLRQELATTQSTIEAQAREIERLKRESACPCCKGGISRATGELRKAADALLAAMETCHICGATLSLDIGPVHCEDSCSSDCSEHEEPNCVSVDVLYARVRAALSSIGVEVELAEGWETR